MSQFALRLPNSLHGYAKEVAQQDQTSLNQFIVTAVAEKLWRLLAVSHTYRPGGIRIISARRVTRTERKLYEEN